MEHVMKKDYISREERISGLDEIEEIIKQFVNQPNNYINFILTTVIITTIYYYIYMVTL